MYTEQPQFATSLSAIEQTVFFQRSFERQCNFDDCIQVRLSGLDCLLLQTFKITTKVILTTSLGKSKTELVCAFVSGLLGPAGTTREQKAVCHSRADVIGSQESPKQNRSRKRKKLCLLMHGIWRTQAECSGTVPCELADVWVWQMQSECWSQLERRT